MINGKIGLRPVSKYVQLAETGISELMRTLQGGNGLSFNANFNKQKTASPVKAKHKKEPRERATAGAPMNIGGHLVTLEEIGSGKMDMTPLPKSLGFGMNQALRVIYGNIRQGCVLLFLMIIAQISSICIKKHF